ncbi:MAG: peptidoglycan-binding protein, partial [Clostridiales bacterium]|nr:peptidoglycan-binding protein [Clostridiales bacterium]
MKKSIVRVLALVLMLTLVITSSAAALKLQKNDKSDNVRRLQQALTQLGYYSGTVDGSFGSGTKAAVSAFQQANSLTVDGIAGSATIALLEKQTGIDIDGNSSSSSSTATGLFKGDYRKLQYTSSGSRVRVLQQALKDLGFTISKVDGVFGQSTFEAVMAFQKATGLTVDGKAGKN